MSDMPTPDTPQPDIPAPSPGPDIPAPPQPDIPTPNPEPGLRPPEPSEPPGDDVPKVGLHREALGKGRQVVGEIMRIRGQSPYLAGDEVSIADLYLAPIFAYVALTPHKDEFLALPGVEGWWERISSRQSFQATQP